MCVHIDIQMFMCVHIDIQYVYVCTHRYTVPPPSYKTLRSSISDRHTRDTSRSAQAIRYCTNTTNTELLVLLPYSYFYHLLRLIATRAEARKRYGTVLILQYVCVSTLFIALFYEL